MRFSHVAIVYLILGISVVATGVMPLGEVDIVTVFASADGTGDIDANASSIEGKDGLDINGLISPVANALNTISGGALLAVWGPISTITGLYAWPLVLTGHIGAPMLVQLAAVALVASFTFGLLRIFRASI